MTLRARAAALLLTLAMLTAACDVLPSGAEPRVHGAGATAPADGVQAAVATIAQQVGEVRGLESDGPVPATVLDPAAFADQLDELEARAEAEEAEDPPPVTTDEAQRIGEALRFLPPGSDLDALTDELINEDTVSGLYVPEDDALFVQSETGELTPGELVTTAHEITHALQDQAFDLTRLDEIEDTDAALAFLSVVEGDAVVTEEAWSQRFQTPEDQATVAAENAEVPPELQERLAQLPPYLVESLIFPYTVGAEFVNAVAEAGGPGAVDRALQDPPTTSAEIIDPQRYLDGFEPEAVPAPAPPEGFTPFATDTFGAFDLAMLLRPVGQDGAIDAAMTWTGGTLAAFDRDGAMVLAVATRFSDPAVAAAVCEAVPAWYAQVAAGRPAGEGRFTGDRDALAVSCGPQEVRFGLGPDPDLAAAAVVAR